MQLKDLPSLHRLVRSREVNSAARSCSDSVDQLCKAMVLACVFYPKRVLCLQRSAATTLLLRCHGWPAELVIGVQIVPFKSHAWVEVDETVVNDKPYMLEIYSPLERL